MPAKHRSERAAAEPSEKVRKEALSLVSEEHSEESEGENLNNNANGKTMKVSRRKWWPGRFDTQLHV